MAEVVTIDAKLAVLTELYREESGTTSEIVPTPPPKKKRPGRPKGAKGKKKTQGSSKHAVADELYDEAMSQLNKSGEGGTSKEMQERMTRRFNPTPRPTRELGPGITAGTRKDVETAKERRTPDTRVSIDEGQ